MAPSVKETPLTKIPAWQLAETLFGKAHNILAYGPPGVGKTYLAQEHAKKNAGFHYITTTLTEDTPMSELRGHFVLRGSEFVWLDGIICSGWRMSHKPEVRAVIIALQEIDHLEGDGKSFLHVALDGDDSAAITLPTKETLRPAPGKVFYWATMNGVPSDLPRPLRSRFPVQIQITEPNPKAIAALPSDVQALARNLTVAEEARRVDLRAFFEFARLRGLVGDEVAAQAIFGARAKELVDALKTAAASSKE